MASAGNPDYVKPVTTGFLNLPATPDTTATTCDQPDHIHLRTFTLSIFSRLVLALILLTGAVPAYANGQDKAADNWVEDHADKQSDDILRKIEKKVKLDPDLKANLKDSIKGLLKDKLKKALLPKAHSIGMQEIIDSIQDALGRNTRRKACDTAAVNQAYWAASNVRRQLTGAAETFVDLLGSVGGVGSLAKKLAESVGKTLGKKILDKVRKALEEALDNYIKNYKVETFSRDFSSGKCTMTMRVIWNKGKGRFDYVILGNCNCSKVSARGSHKVLLERWSVTGYGRARWVGEKTEKANKNASSVKGTPQTRRVKVKSVCCGSDGSVCALPPSKDPWVFTPPGTTKRPTTGTKGGKPKRPTTRTGSGGENGGTKVGGTPQPVKPKVPTNMNSGVALSDEKGDIEIPSIPAGPLCPSDKEQIISKASDAYRRAVELAAAKQRDYDVAKDAGKDSSKTKGAKAALDTANDLKDRAGKALEKAYTIPEQKSCHPSHTSQSMILPDGSDFLATTQPTALTMAMSGPKSCKAGRNCRYSLIVTNDSNSVISGALPITMSTSIGIRSVKPRTKGWYCMTGRGGIQCYTKQLELTPESFTGLELDVRFSNRTRTTRANICFDPSPIWIDGETGPVKNRITIQLLQHGLTRAGYKPGPIDGQMGRRTLRSARAYAKRNFCQMPANIVSDDLLAGLLGGAVIDGVAEQACTTTRVTANRKASKASSKRSGTSWGGVILQYGINRELRKRHHKRRHKEEYRSAPKSEPKEIIPDSPSLECTPDGECY